MGANTNIPNHSDATDNESGELQDEYQSESGEDDVEDEEEGDVSSTEDEDDEDHEEDPPDKKRKHTQSVASTPNKKAKRVCQGIKLNEYV